MPVYFTAKEQSDLLCSFPSIYVNIPELLFHQHDAYDCGSVCLHAEERREIKWRWLRSEQVLAIRAEVQKFSSLLAVKVQFAHESTLQKTFSLLLACQLLDKVKGASTNQSKVSCSRAHAVSPRLQNVNKNMYSVPFHWAPASCLHTYCWKNRL